MRALAVVSQGFCHSHYLQFLEQELFFSSFLLPTKKPPHKQWELLTPHLAKTMEVSPAPPFGPGGSPRGTTRYIAHHSTWQASPAGLHQASRLCLQQSLGKLWPERSRKAWAVVVSQGEEDHLRPGASARLRDGSASLSHSSFKSTFLNVLPRGQRNSRSEHEFFRRMGFICCWSWRYKGDRKGNFLTSKATITGIFRTTFPQHVHTQSYIQIYHV